MSQVESGFRPLKTKEDLRLAFHALVLALVPVLVALFGVTENSVVIWSVPILAAVDAVLSFANSSDGVRKVIYAVGGLAQTVLLVLGHMAESDVTLKVGALVTFLTALVAVFYTPNSVVANPTP